MIKTYDLTAKVDVYEDGDADANLHYGDNFSGLDVNLQVYYLEAIKSAIDLQISLLNHE